MVGRLLDENSPLIVIQRHVRSHDLAAQFIRQHTRRTCRPRMSCIETAADGPWDAEIIRASPGTRRQRTAFHLTCWPPRKVSAWRQIDPELRQLIAALERPSPEHSAGRTCRLPKGVIGVEAVGQAPAGKQTTRRWNRAAAGHCGGPRLTCWTPPVRDLLLVMAAGFADGLSADLLDRVLGTSTRARWRPILARTRLRIAERRRGERAILRTASA